MPQSDNLTDRGYAHNARKRNCELAHEKEYPVLSKMAQIYSGISPGSVPVESLFNCAGLC